MTSVLVTDGEQRAALAAVRSLGQRRRVVVLASAPPCLAAGSRFAAAEHRGAAPLVAPVEFRSAVEDVVARERIDVVLPVSDAACRALLGAELRLGATRLAGPSRAAYERLSHKGEAARLAARVGLAVPEGAEAASLDDALAIARSLGWPLIVKPVRSVDAEADGTLRSCGVARAGDEAALREVWERVVGGGSALVQALVPGRGEGLFVLRWEGCTRAVFAHRRLREKPPAGGASVLCESIAVDPRLRAQVEAVLDACSFSGVAMAELRSDGRTRWLMEFNARLWGSLQLAIDAGVDFPALLVDAVLGEPAPPLPRYQPGIRSRWLLGDLDHALALARGARDDSGHAGIGAALSVLLRPSGPRCRWENPRRGDLRPFAREVRDWLRASLTASGSRQAS
ncbi:MAG: ATP-grasp domain-containing protein [Deltaproteobacteria bacterium]|nr:ATP-grasp domain-containing protein [Deltaproteobacteria bacterium]